MVVMAVPFKSGAIARFISDLTCYFNTAKNIAVNIYISKQCMNNISSVKWYKGLCLG